MQQLLEPGERLAVVEDDRRRSRRGRARPSGADDAVAEPLDDRSRTSSRRSSSWTISSLETVAAPCRANAASASLFPAPMPPVIATATGRVTPRRTLLVGRRRSTLGSAAARPRPSDLGLGLGRELCLGLRLGLSLGLGLCLGDLASASASRLGLDVARPAASGASASSSVRRLVGDVVVVAIGEVEVRVQVHRLAAVGARLDRDRSASTRLSESESRRRSPSISMILTLTAWPCETTSRGFSTWCWASSEMCTSPSTPGQDLDEGAERDDLRDAALDDVVLVVALEHLLPRIVLGLLETQRDALAVAVDVEHLDLHRLADLEDLGRMVDVRPRELGDVDQAVHAVEVDEGAEVDDVRDLALDDVAGLEPVEDLLPLLLALLLEHGAAREHDVVARAVELDHLAAQLLAEELVEVLDAADVDERRRQEAADAEVEDQAALDDLDHAAVDRLAGLGGALDVLPGELEAGALLREDQPALRRPPS